MADVFSALYGDSDYWDGTTSWGGYANQTLRDAHFVGGGFTSVAAFTNDRDTNSQVGDREILEVIGPWVSALNEAHFDIDDFNADSVKIVAIEDNPFDGAWDTGKFIWNLTDLAYGVDLEEAVELDGLQIQANNTGRIIEVSGAGVPTINNCGIRQSGNGQGIYINNASSGFIGNTIVYQGASGTGTAYYCHGGSTVLIYNCVGEGFGSSRGIYENTSTVTAKNCAMFNNSDDFSGVSTIDYCASDDGDGTNSVQPSDWTTVFEDYTTGDFNLKSTDTDLMDNGVGPSVDANVPATDVTGDTRSGATCDISIDEYVAGGVTLVIQEMLHSLTYDSPILTQKHTLIIDALAHAYTIDNVDLVTTVLLVVQELIHAHTIDNITLTQKHILDIQELLLTFQIETPTLTQKHLLIIQEMLHTLSIDNVTLTQKHILAVEELLHSFITDGINLTQKHTLVVDEVSHTHTIDNIDLILSIALVVQELLHTLSIESPTLSQKHTLIVNELLHNLGYENVSMTQKHTLNVDDLLHSYSIDNVVLSVSIILVVQELAHSLGFESPTLTQKHIIQVQEMLHTMGIENIDLTQKHTLVVDELNHTLNYENIVLSVSVLLAVQSLLHTNSIDAPTLTQKHLLAVSELLHTMGFDTPDLTQKHVLNVQEMHHALNIDHIPLSISIILVIQELLHTLNIDAPTLAQKHNLVLADLLHNLDIDSILLITDEVRTVIRTVDPGGTGDYLSLKEFLAGEKRDLSNLNQIAVARCISSNGAIDASANMDFDQADWNTTTENYIRVHANSDYKLEATFSDRKIAYLNGINIKFENTLIHLNHTSSELVFMFRLLNGANVELSQCKFSFNAATGFIYMISANQTGGSLKIKNSIFYMANTSGAINYGIIVNGAQTAYIYNTVINGITASSAPGNCISISCGANSTIVAKNTMTQNTTGVGWEGTGSWLGSTNNLSDDNTAPGDNPINGSVLFKDIDNFDFHLSGLDTIARDAGIDLSADPVMPFTTDIDGEEIGSIWDIGPDKFKPSEFGFPTMNNLLTSIKTYVKQKLYTDTKIFKTIKKGIVDIKDEYPLISIEPANEQIEMLGSGNMFIIRRGVNIRIWGSAFSKLKLKENIRDLVRAFKEILSPETDDWRLVTSNMYFSVFNVDFLEEQSSTPVDNNRAWLQYYTFPIIFSGYYEYPGDKIITSRMIETDQVDVLNYIFELAENELKYKKFFRDVVTPNDIGDFPGLAIYHTPDTNRSEYSSTETTDVSITFQVYDALATREIAMEKHVERVGLLFDFILKHEDLEGRMELFQIVSIDYGVQLFESGKQVFSSTLVATGNFNTVFS